MLPGILGEISDIIGAEAACRLALELGGTRVYVARTPTEVSPIAAIVGLEAARRLAEVWGGDYLAVPNAKRALVCWLHLSGESTSQIARRLKVNERTVRRILTERPGDVRQFTLF